MTTIEPRKIRCSECLEILVRASSGYVCPNGHGRIVPAAVVERPRVEHERWVESLPVAVPAPRPLPRPRRRVYSLNGTGVFMAVQRSRLPAPTEHLQDRNTWGVVAGVLRGEVRWFEPWRPRQLELPT
jgi:hypothetical protein